MSIPFKMAIFIGCQFQWGLIESSDSARVTNGHYFQDLESSLYKGDMRLNQSITLEPNTDYERTTI